LVGQSIGGYTLKSPVGEGGTSAVYMADHPQHGAVAVKILREKLRQDKTAVARFLREAHYGERVSHPNVVRTIEIGESPGGLQFIAIEWAHGELLERYIKRNAPLPRDEVAQIVEQIAGAVHAAHDVNIVHRDLKPENVMYDPATRQIKLLDFGIATDTDISPAERLTRAGFFVGTLMYVAPEALSGELVTPAADQYSLATIAYFLLTGCHPYSAKSPREMFTQLLSKPPIPLNEVKEAVRYGAEVEGVVMRGLAKEPAKRYASVLEFAEALKQALAHDTDAPAGLLDRVKGFFRPKH
jgi:serine/threonine-protein kinase